LKVSLYFNTAFLICKGNHECITLRNGLHFRIKMCGQLLSPYSVLYHDKVEPVTIILQAEIRDQSQKGEENQNQMSTWFRG